MTSRMQASGDEGGSFRPTKLRSSLRRKVSSIFGKRPSSVNFDPLVSSYNDGSLSVSSQSLYSGPQAGSPSLDDFLQSVFNNGSHSENDLNHTESIGSLLQASNVCLNPSPDGSADQSVASKAKGDGKAKDFKNYIKKVAIKRKEKISSSITNLSNKIRDSSLLKREPSFADRVPRRRNTHSSIDNGHFKRTNFRWSCNIPSDVNFCSALSPEESLCLTERGSSSNISHLEPFRHIDSSSEDDFSSVGTGASDVIGNGLYNSSNRNVQPFSRARSAIIQRNRRKVVSYQFDSSIDDFIHDLHDYNQPSAKIEEPHCNNEINFQNNNYPEKDISHLSSANSKLEDIYSNWDVYMAHKQSLNDFVTNKSRISDSEYQYANLESLEQEYDYSDVDSSVPDPKLPCEDEEPSDPEIKTFYNMEFSVPKYIHSIPQSDSDPRQLALFEQTIPEEEDTLEDLHDDCVALQNDSIIVSVDNGDPEVISSDSSKMSSDHDYYHKIQCNNILFTELEIGKRFLSDGSKMKTRSLPDVSKLFRGTALTRNVYLSLGNLTLNCQEITCIVTDVFATSLQQVNVKKRKRRRNKNNKKATPVQISSQADAEMPCPNRNVETNLLSCRRGKRKKRRRRNKKRKNRHIQKETSNQPRYQEVSDCDLKYISDQDHITENSPSTNRKSLGIGSSDFQLAFLNTLTSNGCERSSDFASKCYNLRSCDVSHKYPDLVANCESSYKDHEQAVSWILTEGEECLSNLQVPVGSLAGITKQVEDINELYKYAKDKVEQTLDLMERDLANSESGEKCPEELTKALTQHLASFGDKLNLSKDNLEDTAKCYLLLDKAYEWALRAMKVVGALKTTGVVSPEQVSLAAKTVSTYLEENPPVPGDAFDAMISIATKLDNQTLLQQCKVAQARCCDTLSLLKNRHSALLKARRQVEFDCQSFVDLRELMGGVEEFSPLSWLSNSTLNNSGRRKSVTSLSSRSRDPLSRCSSLDTEEDLVFSEPLQTSTPNKQTLESRTSLGNIKELRESAEDLKGSSNTSVKSATNSGVLHSSSGPAFSSGSSSCSSSGSYPSLSADRLLNKSPSWQYHKASSQVSQECPHMLLEECLPPISTFNKSYPPFTTNSHLLIRGSQINLSNTEDLTEEEIKRNKTLLLIMQELKQTEKDYVNSLEYIIENYIPELLREDIPQALRGQRNVIFGNIEKIFEFHSNYFLIELESCHKRPFSVGSVFLKFEKQFYLYALYNKNKPKSDSLMAEYGTSFFKSKQLELGDKMDLSSYLLKPVQRMGKYALLLKQLLKECSREEEDQEELVAAQEMVQFQLRHGNDLLAMDSLRDCDVNLKEQGRLLRQGELTVSEGNRKKSIRHVFLFEDLILFSKSRRDPEKKNLEIFQYKYSMKMTDIGMTEQVGENSNRFEIWFRKRKPGDTYVLQANTVDLKESWTEVISKVLWRQALKNRSLRLHEMSSMGIGNKPCLDIRPSEDQICERSVCINQRGSARFKPTIPYMDNSPRRPHSVISVASSGSTGASSSNSSSTGPTFAGALNLGFEPGDSPRPLTRSVTRTSQCSAESGIMADIYSEKETSDRHHMVERSNSSVTTISGDSVLSPITALVSHVCTPSAYVNAIPQPAESCQLSKDRSTGSFLTTEV